MLSREQDEDQKLQLSYFANFEHSILDKIVSSKRGLDNFPCPSAGNWRHWREGSLHCETPIDLSLRLSHEEVPSLLRNLLLGDIAHLPPFNFSSASLSYIYKYKMHEIQIQNTRNANRKEAPPSTFHPSISLPLLSDEKEYQRQAPLTFCQTRISWWGKRSLSIAIFKISLPIQYHNKFRASLQKTNVLQYLLESPTKPAFKATHGKPW